jgi:hypothetical protein
MHGVTAPFMAGASYEFADNRSIAQLIEWSWTQRCFFGSDRFDAKHNCIEKVMLIAYGLNH